MGGRAYTYNLTKVSATPEATVGQCYTDRYGREYVYVKNAAASITGAQQGRIYAISSAYTLIAAASANTDNVQRAGMVVSSTDLTASYYLWVQTYGDTTLAECTYTGALAVGDFLRVDIANAELDNTDTDIWAAPSPNAVTLSAATNIHAVAMAVVADVSPNAQTQITCFLKLR